MLYLYYVPSCWSQPFALRTVHELLRARHLALSAMQQIAPLFDTQFPALLTDISVLNTLRSSPGSDISTLDVSRPPRTRITPRSTLDALCFTRIAPHSSLCALR